MFFRPTRWCGSASRRRSAEHACFWKLHRARSGGHRARREDGGGGGEVFLSGRGCGRFRRAREPRSRNGRGQFGRRASCFEFTSARRYSRVAKSFRPGRGIAVVAVRPAALAMILAILSFAPGSTLRGRFDPADNPRPRVRCSANSTRCGRESGIAKQIKPQRRIADRSDLRRERAGRRPFRAYFRLPLAPTRLRWLQQLDSSSSARVSAVRR